MVWRLVRNCQRRLLMSGSHSTGVSPMVGMMPAVTTGTPLAARRLDELREGDGRMWRLNLLEFSLKGKREIQWSLLLVASSSCRFTASRLNEAGFWRGGNFTNASICPATIPCMPYIRYACEIIQS